jgi:aryl-alcohol dehydrogenase-like predicted oxidoreductase
MATARGRKSSERSSPTVVTRSSSARRSSTPTGQDINARGLSRRHIIRGVEASLKRLRTDWLDFYLVHAFDVRTPIEQTVRALDDLQQQGKTLSPAVSNWAAWQSATALGISAREGFARFELIQPNLVRRQAEVEILPLAAGEKLGGITYSPLGGGLLTGKYGMVQIAPGDALPHLSQSVRCLG